MDWQLSHRYDGPLTTHKEVHYARYISLPIPISPDRRRHHHHNFACDRGQVRLGIEAPKSTNIVRSELIKRQSGFAIRDTVTRKANG